jgi:hypothetical protein
LPDGLDLSLQAFNQMQALIKMNFALLDAFLNFSDFSLNFLLAMTNQQRGLWFDARG